MTKAAVVVIVMWNCCIAVQHSHGGSSAVSPGVLRGGQCPHRDRGRQGDSHPGWLGYGQSRDITVS